MTSFNGLPPFAWRYLVSLGLLGCLATFPAAATPFTFSTGNPDGKIATASRPGTAGKFEIESADDFVLSDPTRLTNATFTGLLSGGISTASIGQVRVEIYRVFPDDSDVGRTSGPPTFSTAEVPTRVNSPSDVAIFDRDTALGNLTFSVTVLTGSFTASNSVQSGGIHSKPNQTTTGDGAVTGEEVRFDVNFTTPLDLPADHYFFVPQVAITSPGGDFYWLSAPRPIVPPGTPFPPGFTDLQSWTRDQLLDPDWLRVGTDIVGSGAFNAVFSLAGQQIPEPGSLPLLGLGFAGLAASRKRKPQ
jgi:hypothetical protein